MANRFLLLGRRGLMDRRRVVVDRPGLMDRRRVIVDRPGLRRTAPAECRHDGADARIRAPRRPQHAWPGRPVRAQ